MGDEIQPTRNNKSFFPAASTDDIKLLVITFVGTVAANLITVLIVGLAVIIAREHIFNTNHANGVGIAALIFMTFSTIILPVLWLSGLRRMRHRTDTPGPIVKMVMVSSVVMTGIAILLILTWVGIASGIK
jgi:hypothetical protein